MSIPPRIGFIGLGTMGREMAMNLVKAGFKVSVYNRTRKRTIEFADLGCEVAATPRALAKLCDLVITMVSDPAAMDAVIEGPEGVSSAFAGGNTLINMSTLSPDYTSALAKKCFVAGVNFLDCPVSGSKGAAEGSQLVILAGGKKDIVEKFSPVLKAMGRLYDTARYKAKLEELRSIFPGVGLYADIIAGYPTETEDDFEAALKFVRDCALSGLHVFSFSARPGTRAAALKALPQKTVAARSTVNCAPPSPPRCWVKKRPSLR